MSASSYGKQQLNDKWRDPISVPQDQPLAHQYTAQPVRRSQYSSGVTAPRSSYEDQQQQSYLNTGFPVQSTQQHHVNTTGGSDIYNHPHQDQQYRYAPSHLQHPQPNVQYASQNYPPQISSAAHQIDAQNYIPQYSNVTQQDSAVNFIPGHSDVANATTTWQNTTVAVVGDVNSSVIQQQVPISVTTEAPINNSQMQRNDSGERFIWLLLMIVCNCTLICPPFCR